MEILLIDETVENKKKRQSVDNPKGTIALVHDICHGVWCWEYFIDFFAGKGYRCYAISLPRHSGKDNL